MKVLIIEGLVHEIFGEVAPEVHKDLLIVNAPYDVEEGWVYDGSSFSPPEPLPEPSCEELRSAAYPSIQAQLDMQYWDKINGTDNWSQTIAAVKDKHPKEE